MIRPLIVKFLPKNLNVFQYVTMIRPARKAVKQVLHGPYFEMLDIFETKMDCEGLCTPPLIFLARDVTKGPPKKACLYSVVEYVNTEYMRWGWYLFSLGCCILLLSTFGCCAFQQAEQSHIQKWMDDPDNDPKNK